MGKKKGLSAFFELQDEEVLRPHFIFIHRKTKITKTQIILERKPSFLEMYVVNDLTLIIVQPRSYTLNRALH